MVDDDLYLSSKLGWFDMPHLTKTVKIRARQIQTKHLGPIWGGKMGPKSAAEAIWNGNCSLFLIYGRKSISSLWKVFFPRALLIVSHHDRNMPKSVFAGSTSCQYSRVTYIFLCTLMHSQTCFDIFQELYMIESKYWQAYWMTGNRHLGFCLTIPFFHPETSIKISIGNVRRKVPLTDIIPHPWRLTASNLSQPI